MMEISMDDFSPNEPDEFEYMYRHIETIASGSFGTVIKALDLHHQKEVAVKIISKENLKKALLKQIEEEVEILERLNHKHIVHFENCIETKTRMYIIMEYCAGGTLKAYLDKHSDNLTESIAKVMINSLLSAVNYLHQRDICHRDIKPENIMLKHVDDITSLKLVDFGLSAQYFEYKGSVENCGTLLYMAPEQIHNKTYSKGVDVWSVGIVLYMMLNGNKHPFWMTGDSRKGYIAKLKEMPTVDYDQYHHQSYKEKEKGQQLIKVYGNCSEMSKSLVGKLLEWNPSFRYTAQNALEHPWISGRKYDAIPKTVFEKLKDEESKKKMIMLLNTALFIKKYRQSNEGGSYEVSREYIDKVNLTNIKSKEKFIVMRERLFALRKETLTATITANAINRPASQNTTNNNLLFKLNRNTSKGELLSKGKKRNDYENTKENSINAQGNKSRRLINPNPNTSNNNSLEKKDFAKKVSRGFNFPANKEGYVHYQPNSSKNVYQKKPRNMSSYKRRIFHDAEDSKTQKQPVIKEEIAPFIEKKKTINPLVKIKVPFKKTTTAEAKIRQNKTIKNEIRGIPLYLPKIVF